MKSGTRLVWKILLIIVARVPRALGVSILSCSAATPYRSVAFPLFSLVMAFRMKSG